MAKRILQFGTSRFLQGHADFFVHEARQQGQDIGPITVVKTTRGGAREGRVAAFSDPKGFPVRLRGYKSGQLVDETTQVTSVRRALDANTQWAELKRINAALWDIEDYIRDEERAKRFGDRFIELARAVYVTNDDRAAVKRKINDKLGSTIKEEKSYADY